MSRHKRNSPSDVEATEEEKIMNKTPDEVAIRTLIQKWAAAVRRQDMEAICRDHAEDLVMFDVPPPLEVRGLASYVTTWEPFFRMSPRPVVFDIKSLEIIAGDDVAFAMALVRCSNGEVGAPAGDLDFRLTVGLRKIGGRWTVLHEHHSVPAESPPSPTGSATEVNAGQ
jgi:ketosteroid isomerase-like protein